MKNNPVIFVYALMMLNGWSASYAQAKPSDTSGRPGHYKEYKNDKNDTANLNVNDTIQQFKRSREFAYMNDLDSILRTESGLKNDTVKLDEHTGRMAAYKMNRNENPQ